MDRVGDLLIRIKNGYMATRREVRVSYSKLALAILALLQTEGYIGSFKEEGREILVQLKYQGRSPALTDVTRISKPGRRVYKGKTVIPQVLDGMGVAIVSTPRGVMTGKQARKEGVGGEIMAYVW